MELLQNVIPKVEAPDDYNYEHRPFLTFIVSNGKTISLFRGTKLQYPKIMCTRATDYCMSLPCCLSWNLIDFHTAIVSRDLQLTSNAS